MLLYVCVFRVKAMSVEWNKDWQELEQPYAKQYKHEAIYQTRMRALFQEDPFTEMFMLFTS